MKVILGDWGKNGVDYEDRKKIVKIHSWDTYSLDTTLAIVIGAALKRYKKDRKKMGGVPSCFIKDSKYTNEPNHDDAIKEWKAVLDKMIWSFNEIATQKEEPSGFGTNEYKIYKERMQEGIDLFAKHYLNLWW